VAFFQQIILLPARERPNRLLRILGDFQTAHPLGNSQTQGVIPLSEYLSEGKLSGQSPSGAPCGPSAIA
jgi:hypothetical protein